MLLGIGVGVSILGDQAHVAALEQGAAGLQAHIEEP